MAFANHDHVGAGVSRDDFRHRTKKLVRAPLCLGRRRSGIFPGSCFYLSSWFPKEYRTRILAWFLVAIPASSVFGGPLSGIFLGMDGVGGLAGWKWLFLLEGLPTILLGIIFPWVLTNRPVEARWLTAEEQRVVVERIQSEKRDREMRHLLPALRDARVLLLSGIFFGFTVGSYGLGIWLRKFVKEQQISNLTVGFITAGCYVVACIGMVARSEEHTSELQSLAYLVCRLLLEKK